MKKIINNRFLPAIICFAIMAIMLCLVYTGWGDDVYFKSCNGLSFIEFINYQFHIKSRIILDILLVAVLQLPQPVWGIITAGLFALSSYIIVFLFSENISSPSVFWFTALLFLSYNFLDMNEAGWYATTVNYIWPLAFGLVSFIPVKNALRQKKERAFLYPIYIISLFIGSNEEQMAAIIAAFMIIFCIYLRKNDKLTPFVVIETVISLLVLIYMAFGPSNKVRIVSEAETWFPQFLELNLLDKCYIGITTTAMDLLFTNNLLVYLFMLLLPVFTYKLTKNKYICAISLIPFVLIAVNNLFFDFFLRLCPQLENITDQFRAGRTYFERAADFTLPVHYSITMLAMSALLLAPPLICAYFLFQNTEKRWLAVLIVLAGYASRFMIGLSPTCIGGGMRTAYFLYASFVAFLVLLFNNCRSKIDYSKLFMLLASSGVLQLIQLKYFTALIK